MHLNDIRAHVHCSSQAKVGSKAITDDSFKISISHVYRHANDIGCGIEDVLSNPIFTPYKNQIQCRLFKVAYTVYSRHTRIIRNTRIIKLRFMTFSSAITQCTIGSLRCLGLIRKSTMRMESQSPWILSVTNVWPV